MLAHIHGRMRTAYPLGEGDDAFRSTSARSPPAPDSLGEHRGAWAYMASTHSLLKLRCKNFTSDFQIPLDFENPFGYTVVKSFGSYCGEAYRMRPALKWQLLQQ